ncbi:Yos1-like protein [Irpex lacteus]|nr:Yos1-like protein [Irpex lacteus]
MLSIGSLIYVSLLLINAMAVLSEDRFLAKIGWASTHVQAGQAQAAYAQGYGQPYDQQGQDVGMKGRLINLISAVRTLMRIPLIAFNLVIIGYELILGG